MSVQHRLLECLVDGHFHSGQQLAKTLGVSRAAIWKHIRTLISDYQLDIHAVTGKGYRLSEPVELLNADEIRAQLPESLSELRLHTFLSLDSTNQYLLKRLDPVDDIAPSAPVVVFAEQQTAGRGRHGRHWVSPFGGNLYFSIRYTFDSPATALAGLSLALGVAIAEFLAAQGVQRQRLKWPNDILINGRKLCGILLEMQGEMHGPGQVVIGVGLNVRIQSEAASQIDQPWVSLSELMPAPIWRNQLAGQLLANLFAVLQEFEQHGLSAFLQRWQTWDAYRDTPVRLLLGEREISGIARGIDAQGALLLEQQGRLQRYYSGEIRLRAAT